MVRILAGAVVGAFVGGYGVLAGVDYASDYTRREQVNGLVNAWCYLDADADWRQNVLCKVGYVIVGEY